MLALVSNSNKNSKIRTGCMRWEYLGVAAYAVSAPASGKWAHVPVPPMGWMDWEVFRCSNISETLIKTQADTMVAQGYRRAGYDTVSIDDCWMQKSRDSRGKLVANPQTFPGGIRALAEYVHAKGLKLGSYLDLGEKTCAGFAGSQQHIETDSLQLDEFHVDYIKVDGCNSIGSTYEKDYTAFGRALLQLSRPVVYSCSWPAYEVPADAEDKKPYKKMIAAGCNLWRNWQDIECSYDSLEQIINHFGEYSRFLARFAGPGHFNDMDMLLVGNSCISYDNAIMQMAIWSIMASPLIMGNDLTQVGEKERLLLQNEHVIAINQDPMATAGFRVTANTSIHEVWARPLIKGNLAVTLINKDPSKGANITLHLGDVLSAFDQVYDQSFPDFDTRYELFDVIAKQDLRKTLTEDKPLELFVNSRGARMLRLKPMSASLSDMLTVEL